MIRIEHREKDFNLHLCQTERSDPYLTIRGCRLVNGAKGEFVSWPARKMDNGKYWNHCTASDTFVAAVVSEYHRTKPQGRPAPRQRERDDDAPF